MFINCSQLHLQGFAAQRLIQQMCFFRVYSAKVSISLLWNHNTKTVALILMFEKTNHKHRGEQNEQVELGRFAVII